MRAGIAQLLRLRVLHLPGAICRMGGLAPVSPPIVAGQGVGIAIRSAAWTHLVTLARRENRGPGLCLRREC